MPAPAPPPEKNKPPTRPARDGNGCMTRFPGLAFFIPGRGGCLGALIASISLLSLVALLTISSACRKPPNSSSSTAPSPAEVEADARFKLHKIAKSSTFGIVLYDIRTAPSEIPSHLGTLSGDWTNERGEIINFKLKTFFKSGAWHFDPGGSAGYILGVAKPEAVEKGWTYLPVIAAELGLAD
jgi:hypothetical protein